MDFPWNLFIDLGVVSLALLLATFIRARFSFFQRFLIPNTLTAGFLLLLFYNFLAPLLGLSSDGLGALVYHLLNISFISMTLRKPDKTARSGSIFSMSVGVLSQYALQAILGLLLTVLFIGTLFPDLFPSFGLFIPLGFSLGPGQAFAIGQGWESSGFSGAGSVGLTFGAFGFLWACFGGVFLINHGIRKGWVTKDQLNIKSGKNTGLLAKDQTQPVGMRLTTETEAIDSMSLHIGVVLLVYLAAFLLLKGLTYILSFAGDAGQDLAVNLWGIAFIFAALIAHLVRQVLTALKVDRILDNGSLTRISGVSVDIMVAGAIGAISLVVVGQYWLPILIMGILAGLIALIAVPWLGSRIFKDHRFQRTLILFGVATGTLPTGLALLRVVDPDFRTPVASDYMYSVGITFVLAIPFILTINLPVRSHKTGNPLYFWLTLLISLGYLVFVIISHLLLSKGRAFRNPARLWLKEDEEHDESPS